MRASASRMVLGFAVAAAVAGGFVLDRHMAVPVGAAAAPVAEPTAPGVQQRLSALFVGDSFTAGSAVGGATNSYACILARTQGWACNVDAFGATGYLNDGAKFYPAPPPGRLVDRLPADARIFTVDVVFLDAGRNDLGYEPRSVLEALTDALSEVGRLWPTARVVVIMPAYMSATPYANYAALRAGFAKACEAADATLLDPVAEGWYSGADTDIAAMQIGDNVHPNALGHQFLAGEIADSLVRNGLGEIVTAREPA
ncbi:SGNH/GDSL hydrolase family protein [Nocardia sp. NPDC058497]|uniref:SGNH/GDSL hydrolase family protein n=1 Tax=Nocardia sp. NPDC058497 TaxID=3346529 RepID=UPI0036622540